MIEIRPSETPVLREPHGVISQETAFFVGEPDYTASHPK
jgi:hypothetical protein